MITAVPDTNTEQERATAAAAALATAAAVIDSAATKATITSAYRPFFVAPSVIQKSVYRTAAALRDAGDADIAEATKPPHSRAAQTTTAETTTSTLEILMRN